MLDGISDRAAFSQTFFNFGNLLWTLSSIIPHLTVIQDAMIPLREIRRQIERQPFIDVRNEGGIKLWSTGWSPSFALENVTFAYPSRPNIAVLRDINMRIETGTVTAICGASGSGKSTMVSLLLRDFDPETANIHNKDDPMPEATEDADKTSETRKGERSQGQSDVEKAESLVEGGAPVRERGKVLFAGRDIREYNLRWLRSQISVVTQNPQLFTGTVFENVAAGLTGTDLEYRSDIDGAASAPAELKARTAKIREMCFEAMQKAQAWDFVSRLPEGMDTIIAGGRTGVLSGGQRQRLAIARALVKKPVCIVLDEATSALDTDTEEKIRLMLEKEQEERGMTTIVIAHRLSMVAKADRIIVMKDGQVVDQGRYHELMEKDRPSQTFRQLAVAQRAEAKLDAEVHRESIYKQTEGSTQSACGLAAPLSATSIQLGANPPGDVQNLEKSFSPNVGLDDQSRTVERFFALLKSQKWLFTIGVISGLIAGASLPLSAYMLGQAIYSLSDHFARPTVNTWSLWFLAMAFVNLFMFL